MLPSSNRACSLASPRRGRLGALGLTAGGGEECVVSFSIFPSKVIFIVLLRPRRTVL